MRRNRLVYGIGINDANYIVKKQEYYISDNGKRKSNLIWICPIYQKWKNMLQRCYSLNYHNRHPSYAECFVCEEWLTFSNFKEWMEKQEWEGKELDKDILYPGNKEYCPEKCVFISSRVNTFVLDCRAARGKYPIGTYWDKQNDKYVAQCAQMDGKVKHLGRFIDPQEAHLVWKQEKHRLSLILADEQEDERIAKALRVRYL